MFKIYEIGEYFMVVLFAFSKDQIVDRYLFFLAVLSLILLVGLSYFLLYKKAKKEYVRKYVLTEEHINKLTENVKPDSGDDPKDDKDTWKKWLKKNYKYILAGVTIIFGIYYTYSVYSELYTQQEYLNSIASETGHIREQLDKFKAFEFFCDYKGTPVMKNIGVGQDVNLMNHRLFNSQKNFKNVTQVLLQLEDLLLLWNTYSSGPLGEEMVYFSGPKGFPTTFTAEDAITVRVFYNEIKSAGNFYARYQMLESLLSSELYNPPLQKFLQSEEDFILRKYIYFFVSQNIPVPFE